MFPPGTRVQSTSVTAPCGRSFPSSTWLAKQSLSSTARRRRGGKSRSASKKVHERERSEPSTRELIGRGGRRACGRMNHIKALPNGASAIQHLQWSSSASISTRRRRQRFGGRGLKTGFDGGIRGTAGEGKVGKKTLWVLTATLQAFLKSGPPLIPVRYKKHGGFWHCCESECALFDYPPKTN